jgi:catechol 2,3-dioxygenase-like lactoylglutathione lyase family enzyme
MKSTRTETDKEVAMAFRINHLHLKTPDPKKTADFYVQYTGAKVAKEIKRPDGSANYRLDLHGVELNVTPFLEEQKLAQFMGLEHVAIDTNNFDGEVAKIKAAGVKILEERVLPDGRRVCFFEGPQGVRLEFLEWK